VSAPPPRVSVVVPTFNYGAFLPRAVDNALAQDLAGLEVIVADDGSTDDTAAVVARYAGDPRVRYLPLPHGGVSRARNAGIQAARGPYVALLDADDLWPRRDKLSLQAGFLDAHPEVGWIFGDVSIVHWHGRGDKVALRACGFYSEESPAPRRVPLTVEELWDDGFGIPTSSVVVRRSCLDAVGGFDEELALYEDLDLWLRLLRRYPVAFVPTVLVTRHIHGANTGSRRAHHGADLARLAARHGLPLSG